jgi:hypothetical protein
MRRHVSFPAKMGEELIIFDGRDAHVIEAHSFCCKSAIGTDVYIAFDSSLAMEKIPFVVSSFVTLKGDELSFLRLFLRRRVDCI